MAESASKVKKRFIVTNPGSDSDDSNEYRRNNRGHGYRPPPPPQLASYLNYQQHRPSPSQPTLLTTDLPTTNANGSSYLPQSQPSPDSTGSPVADEPVPPPATLGLHALSKSVDQAESPSKALLLPDLSDYHDRSINELTTQQASSSSRKGRILQTLKAPFGSRPLKPAADSPRRLRASPTAAAPDPYSSSSATGTSTSAIPEKIIFVTADSERYVTVDISGAKTAAQIRELILTKLNIFNEDEFQPFAIYQTEIGAYAIGEALSNERLLSLCRDQGDSRGSLKFFVSVASATVHEPVPPMPPIELHPVPPVLPSMVSVNPLRVKRRSRSRNGSFSSQSENLPMEVGYEADLDNPDRDSSKSTSRPPAQQPTTVVSPSSPVPQQVQPPLRRSSIVRHARPASPLVPLEPSPLPSQPSSSDRTRSQRKEDVKYGHALPPLPAPPPLSPNRPSFSFQDEPPPSLAVPVNSRYPHTRSGSDAAAERETAVKAAEQTESQNRQSRARESPTLGKLRSDPSRENLRGSQSRRTYDEDDPNWEPVPTSGRPTTDEPERVSPSISRGSRPHTSSRYRPTSPYTTRVPHTSRPPPPVPSLSESRPSSQPRPGRQPLPPNFVVTWKGEEGAHRKASPASTPSYRLGKNYTKSMDNLKLASPTSSSSRRNQPPQLPMPRPPGNIAYSPSNLSVSGTPKSYEPPRGSFARPLPAQGSPHATSSDFGPSSASLISRGYPSNLMSPSHDPYPRPSSATGDSATSPTHMYSRLISPLYGSTLDSGDSHRSPRTVSPHRGIHTHGVVPGPRPRPTIHSDRSDRSSDIQSGPDTSNTTPPRTPVSPQSPRYDFSEKNGFVVEPSSPSSVDNPMIRDNRSSETTLKQEDQLHYSKLLGSTNSEDTLGPRSQPVKRPITPPPPPPQIMAKGSGDSYGADDDEDDDSDNGGGTWIVRPGPPKSPRPPLTVQIDNGTSTSNSTSTSRQSYRPEVPPKDNLPVAVRRDGGSAARQAQRRPESTFVDAENDSWAPRPPPENIYDHLEKFFPKHDLDKPVIEASSGDTSPTSSEPAAVLPPPVQSINDEKARIRAKKSIRIVVQEHKKRIDRTSRATAADTTYASNLRKRNTKLWGSKLEEVTTGQARALANSSPDSPSGGPTTFKWVRGELIGKGTYGRVYLALNATTGEMIAVKQVELPQTASDKADSRQHMVVQALKSESETLRDLDHPNIVQYLGFEETPTNLSIFLEYVPGGSVGSCLLKHGKFEDNVVRSFTGQILDGLEYLHSKGILHRDLKADNILVEMSGVCKISDFGISKRTEDMHGGAFTAMQGTVFWMAPEVINTQKSGYNNKIDIWSVGCVVLEMWAGMRPWNGEEMLAVMFKLYQSKQPPPVPEDVVLSEEADDFRKQCFAINPDERPSAPELRKHPYLLLPPNWMFTGFT